VEKSVERGYCVVIVERGVPVAAACGGFSKDPDIALMHCRCMTALVAVPRPSWLMIWLGRRTQIWESQP